jgi:hypothetical protein
MNTIEKVPSLVGFLIILGVFAISYLSTIATGSITRSPIDKTFDSLQYQISFVQFDQSVENCQLRERLEKLENHSRSENRREKCILDAYKVWTTIKTARGWK